MGGRGIFHCKERKIFTTKKNLQKHTNNFQKNTQEHAISGTQRKDSHGRTTPFPLKQRTFIFFSSFHGQNSKQNCTNKKPVMTHNITTLTSKIPQPDPATHRQKPAPT